MKYITVKLTEDQARSVLDILDHHIDLGIWDEAEKHNMVPSPEHMAFLRRIRRTLAKAKS